MNNDTNNEMRTPLLNHKDSYLFSDIKKKMNTILK